MVYSVIHMYIQKGMRQHMIEKYDAVTGTKMIKSAFTL